MTDYIGELEKDGYIPLRTQHYREKDAAFPAISPSPNTDASDANNINDQDQRFDDDGNEEDGEDSTDKTLDEDSGKGDHNRLPTGPQGQCPR